VQRPKGKKNSGLAAARADYARALAAVVADVILVENPENSNERDRPGGPALSVGVAAYRGGVEGATHNGNEGAGANRDTGPKRI